VELWLKWFEMVYGTCWSCHDVMLMEVRLASGGTFKTQMEQMNQIQSHTIR